MKLSEAIIEGSKNTAQNTNGKFFGKNRKECCVLGAAFLGANLPKIRNNDEYQIVEQLEKAFSITYKKKAGPCPIKNCSFPQNLPLWWMMVHLNDFHKFTRKNIAEYVMTFEEE